MIRILSRPSVLGRLEIAMAILAVAALVSFVSLVMFADNSTGKASAINIAGSLRMQSYAIALELADSGRSAAERAHHVAVAIEEFDRRLSRLAVVSALPASDRNALTSLFAQLREQWGQQLRPLIHRVARDPAALSAALPRIRVFVTKVDQFVALLDEELESQIKTLKIIQGITLFLMVIIIFVAIFMLREQLNATLSNLLRFAREVRQGDFSVRAPSGGDDEFAELSEAFNFMAEDLSRMYATLEAQVAQKTAELERSNRSLSLLYRTARLLAHGPLSAERLREVLQRVESDIGLPTQIVCAHNPNQEHGVPIAINTLGGAPEACAAEACADCFAAKETSLRPDRVHPGGQILNIPLFDGSYFFGTMPVLVPAGADLQAWKIELLEAIGRQISTALGAAERGQQERRVALLEERSVIARELHDSLAQSLSYLKIQVARLERQIDLRAAPEARGVVDELRAGLNNAYRQLRELLTTFRLSFDGRGLDQALRDAAAEFEQRGVTSIEVHNTLAGIELSANEQLHVVQIIREALSNVEHHANAAHTWIKLVRTGSGLLRITIEDDGVGLQASAARPHHYGTSIMRDRAASLGGTLDIVARPQGGTCVELAFQAKMLLAAGRSAAAVLAPGASATGGTL